jgi:TIR domain
MLSTSGGSFRSSVKCLHWQTFRSLSASSAIRREDDEGSDGALSALRERIQQDLRAQLGRSFKTFRLWQDKEAIPSGALWESEIKNAAAQSVFFIPIITPTVVASPYCRLEFESFLAREAELGRNDLVFPILYIDVPALEDNVRRQNDPVLSLIAQRQYVDWREFRYLDVNATEVRREVGRFCKDIRDALRRPWLSPEERRQQEEAAAQRQAEAERQRGQIEAKRRAEKETQQKTAEEARQKREAEAKRARIDALEANAREEEGRRKRQAGAEQQRAEAKHRADEERRKHETETEQRRKEDAEAKRGALALAWMEEIKGVRERRPLKKFAFVAVAASLIATLIAVIAISAVVVHVVTRTS